jgi:hypothetical protein
MARFDHIEVHVTDIQRYCRFLEEAFEGGSHEVISRTGTSMFTSPDGIRIEVKIRKTEAVPVMSGFCNPCLRRPNPHELAQRLGLPIDHELDTEFGKVVFFRDHEGVMWHVKDLP